MTYIGIDPGKKGFISVYSDEVGSWEFYAVPLIKNEIDLSTLNNFFFLNKEHFRNSHAVIENVHALFGSAAKATFSFGYVAGVLETFLVA